MTKRVSQNRKYAATGFLIAALLVMVISSIPAMAVAGLGGMQSQSVTPMNMVMPGSFLPGEDGQDMAADASDMGQYCPMAFGCLMMSSGSHCAPPVLVSLLPVCEGFLTVTATVGQTDAPLHPATITFFHFRPPIL